MTAIGSSHDETLPTAAAGAASVSAQAEPGKTPSALASRDFRLYLAGQLVSQSGSWVQRIAQSWLVLELTESAVALGTVTAMQFLPILLLSLFAGALADRYPKKQFLAVIQVALMAQALILAALVVAGQIALWHVYVLALVHGIAAALEQPARQAFPAELVGRDLLPHAVALNSAAWNSARVLGPAVGGVVIAGLGLAAAFILNAMSYLAVLIALALIRAPERMDGRKRGADGRILAELAEVFRYAAGRPTIVFTLGVMTCLGIFGFNYSTFLPLLARYQLDLGPSGYGLLSTALGCGAVAGAVAMARWRYASRRSIAIAGIVFAVLLGTIGAGQSFLVSLVFLVGLGAAGVTFTTSANTGLQLAVPDEMRGRIMGIYSLLLMGMTPPGAAITGALAEPLGIGRAMIIEAVVCLGGLAAGLAYLRWARRRAISS